MRFLVFFSIFYANNVFVYMLLVRFVLHEVRSLGVDLVALGRLGLVIRQPTTPYRYTSQSVKPTQSNQSVNNPTHLSQQGFAVLATFYFMKTPRDRPARTEEIKSSIRSRGRKVSK